MSYLLSMLGKRAWVFNSKGTKETSNEAANENASTNTTHAVYVKLWNDVLCQNDHISKQKFTITSLIYFNY